MIKAIVNGSKTVTRRLLNPQPFHLSGTRDIVRWQPKKEIDINMTDHSDLAVQFAPYHIDEIVYVKEAWAKVFSVWPPYEQEGKTPYHIEYKSDTGDTYPGHWPSNCKDDEACGRWKSPLFLPEKFARYFIQIVSVRPERLQDVTEGDALKEGVEWTDGGPLHAHYLDTKSRCWWSFETAREAYIEIWDSINKENQWESNPFVWRIEFRLGERAV